jgi:isopenicillin-N epimerase
VRSQCHALAAHARERIQALTELPPVCPDSTDWYMQMFTAALPPCDAQALKRRLYDEFKVEVPIMVWQGQPYIRVSIQAYNTRSDVERLVAALAQLLGT